MARILSSVAIVLAVACGVLTTPSAARAEGIEVHDWLLLVSDPHVENTSAAEMFQSTMPDFVGRTRRPSSEDRTNDPMPIGVLTLHGDADDPTQLFDVLVESPKARFLDHWPRAAARSYRLLWSGMTLTPDSDDTRLATPGHWSTALRQNGSLYIKKEGRAERFMLYDAEIPLKTPIKMALADDKEKGEHTRAYTLTNIGAHLLRDVAVYAPTKDGWMVGRIPRLAAKQTPGESKTPEDGEQPDATAADTSGDPKGDDEPGSNRHVVQLTKPLSAKAATDAWRDAMKAEGFTDVEATHMATMLRRHALSDDRATVVCRLGDDFHAEHLKLDVTPEPKHVRRFTLLVIRNADPGIEREITQLVSQLGDPIWKRREEATAQLAKLGKAAEDALKKAIKSDDLEIVFRAERLLARLDVPGKKKN